jgi:hypothetical protein
VKNSLATAQADDPIVSVAHQLAALKAAPKHRFI